MEVWSHFRSSKILRKTISIIVIGSFLCSNIALADPLKNKTDIPQKDRSVISPNNIVIEKDHGLIKSKFTGNSKKLIINIQDAHCNYEAQTNIVNILEGLINNYSLSLVSVEGADGLIDTTWFKAFPDEEVRKEVATYFMKKGEITGPEYLSITKDYKIRLFGAEDRSSYIQNLNAFTSSYPLKADTEKYYNSIKAALSRLKGFIYNDGLKAMDVKSQDYESKKLQFNDYIRFLQEMAEKTKINIRSYDNFFRLVSVLIYEKKIDFTVTDKERSALIDELSRLLPKDALTELVSQSIAFKSGKISSVEFYGYLKKSALDNNIDISKTYPNLYNYIIYNSVYSRIENEKLFNDIKELDTAIKEKLFTSDDQRALEKLSRHVEMLLGMVNIKLLNGDFNYYQTHRDEFTHEVFTDFIRKEGVKYGLAYEVEPPTESVAKAMPKLEDFYAIATKRDKALIENTLAEMDREKQDVAVLVTGGFHSEGMAKLLEKEGISYIVVCPAITKDVPTPYIQILTNQKAPFDDIVTSPEAAKKGMLAPMLRTELMSMSRQELKNYLKDIPIPEEDLERLEASIWATVEEIAGKAYPTAIREWLKIVMKAVSGHKLARDENFMKARYCDSVRAVLKKGSVAGADNFVAMMKKAPEFNAAFHSEFSRAMPQQDSLAVSAAPLGSAMREDGAGIVSRLGVLPGGFEWVPGHEGKVCREKTLPGQSPSTIEYRQQPNGSWWVFSGGLPANGEDHARQESISSSLKTMITDAGLTPEILQDPKARAKKIAEYDAHVGGVREIMEGRSEEETTPKPANIQKGAISKEEKIGFLRSVAKGERAWAVFGAGRASRMKLPAVFDELGIAGLTPRILKALPRTDDPLDASDEMLGLIEFAREGNMRDPDDISFIQRQLIRLRNQIEQMVKETPEAGLTVEQVLAGVIFIDVVNEDNRDAMANQLLAIKFAGLNPGNIFFIEQPEEGGEEILPNGQTRWFDDERWPEGHGDPFIAIAQRPESAYRIGEGGRLVPTGKTLREVLMEKGTTKALFAQVNDLHLIEDMANVERWRTALALMAGRKAEMVMEMVDNKIVVKGEVTRQKGGATFNSRDDDSAIMRDTIALKTADLEKYAFPQSLSRMFYILDIPSLGKVSETSIPAYLNERETRVGQKPVLTREFYSGDASSVLRSLTMQQGGGFDIYTFKMRSRIDEALTTIGNQDNETSFRRFVDDLLAEMRGVGAIREKKAPALVAAEPDVINIVKIDFVTVNALAKATGLPGNEVEALRMRLAEKVGKDKPSLGGSIVYYLGKPVWVMPYGIGFSEGRTAVFSLASEALIADFDTQASDWRLKEGVLTPHIGNARAREGVNVAIALANEDSETFAMGNPVDWKKYRYGADADNDTIVDRENPSIEYRRGPDETFIGPQGGLPAVASVTDVLGEFKKFSTLPVSLTNLPQVSAEGKTPSEYWSEVFSSIAFDETVYRRVEQEGDEAKEQATGVLAYANANEGVDADITPLDTYGKNDFPKIIRTAAQMQDVLMNPGTQAMPEAYFMYRGVFASRGDIQKAFYDNKVRYDITVLPPGQWGSEPNKTFGHYHEPKDMPEIYQVLSGEAIYLQQKLNDKGEVVDAIMVRAKAGDIVIMLPGYGHVSINTSPDKPLVMANWLTWNQTSYYGSFEKNRGGAYYATRGADGKVTMDKKNPNYKNTPPLREMRPAESISAFGLKRGEPIYNLVHNARFPQSVRFLNYPKEYRNELTPERTLRPTLEGEIQSDNRGRLSGVRYTITSTGSVSKAGILYLQGLSVDRIRAILDVYNAEVKQNAANADERVESALNNALIKAKGLVAGIAGAARVKVSGAPTSLLGADIIAKPPAPLPEAFPSSRYERIDATTIRDRGNHSIVFTLNKNGEWSTPGGGLPAGYDEDADDALDSEIIRIVDDAVRELPITGQHAASVVHSMKVEAAGLQDALVQLQMTKASQKKIAPVVILFDTALDPNAATTGVAQAGERAIKRYLGGSIIEVRGTGVQLLEKLPEALEGLDEYKIVAIAGNETKDIIERAIDENEVQNLQAILNVQNNGNYIPVIGLYDVALRLAYDLDLDNILRHLNTIAVNGQNQMPFTSDDLKRGIITILPKMGPVTGHETEVYKAAEAVLRSL